MGKGAETMPRRAAGNAESQSRVTHRKQLRTEDARFDDVIQVCFETSDEVWLGVKNICPEILELQEFVTRIMKQTAPKLDDSKPVSKPPSYSLDGMRTKIRCFKTERTLWARYVWWAAVSGRDLKELLSGVLFAYVSKNLSKVRRER